MSGEAGGGYASVRLGLRAPRVVIVFDGGEDWEYWARCALYQATLCWGGQGFVLVPQVDGSVDPVLLDAVRAYDPDYVLTAAVTRLMIERLRPGTMRFTRDGVEVAEEERQRFLQEFGDDEYNLAGQDKAQRAISAACSSYQFTSSGDVDGDVDEPTHLSLRGTNKVTLAQTLPGFRGARCAAIPSNLSGPIGLSLAAQFGATEPPDPNAAPSGPVELSSAEPWELSLQHSQHSGLREKFLLDGDGPDGTTDGMIPTAFEIASVGLTTVTAGHAFPRTLHLVAGASANDFALAYALDRLYGRTYWLHPDWYPENLQVLDRWHLKHALEGQTRSGARLRLCSVSAPGELDQIAAQIEQLADYPGPLIEPAAATTEQRKRLHPEIAQPAWLRQGRRHLGVIDQFDQRFALPATSGEDGGTTLAVPTPSPRATSSDLIADTAAWDTAGPRWHVDVDIQPSVMPRARRLPRQAMLVTDPDKEFTWIRSGRDGISYEPWSWGLVLAGATIEQQMVRPQLRELGMLEWAAAVSELSGLTVHVSSPGRAANLLAAKWGSRSLLAADFASPLRQAIEETFPSSKSTATSYPSGDGIRLDADRGVLSFDGFARHWGAGEEKTVRGVLDRLTSVGVLRRGLVLRCGECQKVEFVHVDELRQANSCNLCGAESQLSQTSWRQPNEPVWFYDAHPTLRNLVSTKGHVPLLLADHLRSQAATYADTAEFELHNGERKTAEVDLLAHMDGIVVVAEAKGANSEASSARLDTRSKRGTAARKRAISAQALRADQIVLATTQATWEQGSIDAMHGAINALDWVASPQPQLRLVTGLGTPFIHDELA